MMTKNQKEVSDGESLPQLPSDVIAYDILTRIPIDCLMRFRLVCKSWSALIIDSDFIKQHSIRACPSRGYIALSEVLHDSVSYDETEERQNWRSGVKKSKGVSFYDVNKYKYKIFYFRKGGGLYSKNLKIRGSCDGLVILSCVEEYGRILHHYHHYSNHVFNPVTRNSIKLPSLNEFDTGLIDDLPCFHLVFDPVMEKYKVVCIAWKDIQLQPSAFQPVFTRQFFFKIVTLGTGTGSDSWRNIDIPNVHVSLRGDGYKPVSANGCLNLLCRGDRKVLRIDVSGESYHTIDYPEGASETSNLLETMGSLCILHYTKDNTNRLGVNNLDIESKGKFTLWVLTEEEDHKKWIKKCNIDMFHETSVARPYSCDPVFVTTISNPTLQIIFRVTIGRYEYENDDDEDRYYSYDVELEMWESIFMPYPLEYIANGILTVLPTIFNQP